MKTGCYVGIEGRSDDGNQLHSSWLPYSVIDVGLAGQWTAV